MLRRRPRKIRILTASMTTGVFDGMGFEGTHILKDLLRDG